MSLNDDKTERFLVKFTIDKDDIPNMEITADKIIEILMKELRGSQSFVEVWEADEQWKSKY